ncbi:MAG: N-acetyltransferase [Bacteroidales bacterium]|nr:N-acetyltransferase [Bacteroidales bacterium]MDD4683736.1 N-acetyltransferase [Bacteroidales bacterium]
MDKLIRIEEVQDKKGFNQFLKFPYKLFKNDKMWVPSLIMDEKTTFNKKKNPALEFCDHKIFLAYRGEEVVGRIVGILNNKANEIWNQKRMRFGWFDYIDDLEVTNALLKAVEAWSKERGMDEVVGPMGFTDMDKEGMMVEGFDVNCPIACYYNPSYYSPLIEKLGYVKEVDWVQYEIPANQPVPEKLSKINNLIKAKYNLKIVEGLSKKEIVNQYGKKIFHVVNKSFAGLFGYVPLNDRQIDFYIGQYFSFIEPRLVCFIVDDKDDVVAFGVSMPSLSNALRKSKGKLFPFGWYHLLKALKNYSYIDLYINGVDPDWQNKGVHSLYYVEMNKRYIELGAKMAIANPQLESNQASQIWEKYESRIAIRRRAYIKQI